MISSPTALQRRWPPFPTEARALCPRIKGGGLSERPMELVLKTSGQKCLVGSNPTPSAKNHHFERIGGARG